MRRSLFAAVASLCLIAAPFAAAAPNVHVLSLKVGQTATVHIPEARLATPTSLSGLDVSASDDSLKLTALRPGRTQLRVNTAGEGELTLVIYVTSGPFDLIERR